MRAGTEKGIGSVEKQVFSANELATSIPARKPAAAPAQQRKGFRARRHPRRKLGRKEREFRGHRIISLAESRPAHLSHTRCRERVLSAAKRGWDSAGVDHQVAPVLPGSPTGGPEVGAPREKGGWPAGRNRPGLHLCVFVGCSLAPHPVLLRGWGQPRGGVWGGVHPKPASRPSLRHT